jgi:hypothetical protein
LTPGIEHQILNFNFRRAHFRRSAEQRAEARQQFAEFEGLSQIIVGTVVQPGDAIIDCITRGQH